MSLRDRIGFGVLAGWGGNAVGVLVNMVVVPVLFRCLAKDQLGLWYLIAGTNVFVSLLGLGFVPTFTRHIAFAKGKSGADPDVQLGNESLSELEDLIASARRIFPLMSVGVFAVTLGMGFFFLRPLEVSPYLRHLLWIAWPIMCVGHALRTWAGFPECILRGVGDVGFPAMIAAGLSVLTAGCTIAVAVAGGGLLGLAIVWCVSGLLMRVFLSTVARLRHADIMIGKGRWDWKLVRPMLRPSWQTWVMSFGAFLILKTDQYFIALFRGASDIPNYAAAYSVVLACYGLAAAVGAMVSPFLSQAFMAGDMLKCQLLALRSVRFGLFVMVGLMCVLATVGKELIGLWLGPKHFVGYPVLWTFCVMLTLECQHVLFAGACVATGDIPFGPWAMGAGVLNIFFTWLLISPLGLWGVALGTIFAQALTNNWYAVYRSLHRLHIPMANYFRQVALPVVCFGGFMVLTGRAVVHLLPGGYAVRLLSTGALLGSFTFLVLWRCALGSRDRLLVRRILSSRVGLVNRSS
jgi:O-antigen/teichoic acid export membrane protein